MSFRVKIWLMMAMFCAGSLSAQTYSVGDVYTSPDGSQGIVYYLLPDGTGGWVVALQDASSGCLWGDNTDVPSLANCDGGGGLLYFGDTSCYAHTQALRNYQIGGSYAAETVDFDHGWVLPTIGQLRMLYSQLPFISTAITNANGMDLAYDYYWSCNEVDAEHAWVVDFGHLAVSGALTTNTKNNSYHVRAVRSFSYITNSSGELNYHWSTGSTQSSISVIPGQTTTYTVLVTPVGCSNGTTASKTITVIGPPDVVVTPTSETLCSGDSVILQANVTNAPEFMADMAPPIAVGDILCTDNSIVKPSAWPVEGQVAMGVILYVDNTGEHGWAIDVHESGMMPWSNYTSNNISGMPSFNSISEAMADFNGSSNTWWIRSASDTRYPAANAVDFDNGWYLPAAGQLSMMYAEIPTLNTTLSIVGGTQFSLTEGWYYASSTVAVPTNPWCVDWRGYIIHYLPTLDYNVRSMRNF